MTTTTGTTSRRWAEGGMFGTAEFDAGEVYRFDLTRTWDPTRPAVAFVMLNPSTADERIVDRTVARCIGFARAWGYGRLIVRNCFAFRATDPARLKETLDPVGPGNDDWIRRLHDEAAMVVAAWGVHAKLYGRQHEVRRILKHHPNVRCLGTTKDGAPRHPLYLPKTAAAVRYGRAGR